MRGDETRLPPSWLRVSLGDVAEFVMGQAPPGSECNHEGAGTVFVKAGEFGALRPVVREWTTRPLKLAKDGDVLICVVGATAGKLNLAIDCAIGRSVAAIRPSTAIDQRFLYLQLLPRVLELRAGSAGSAQGVISSADLRSIEMFLPTIAEQRRIVAAIDEHLTKLDAAMVLLTRARANVKRYRSAVLSLTHDPSRLRLAFHLPESASELWSQATLADLSWDSGYGTSIRCEYDAPGPPVLRIPNIDANRIELLDLKFATSPQGLTKADALRPGDFLLVRTNGSRDLIGRAAVVTENLPHLTFFASYLIRFRLSGSTSLWRWIATVWQAPQIRAELESLAASSAGQYNLSLSKLERVRFPRPPDSAIEVIVPEVERHLSYADRLDAQINSALGHAARVRQAVLKRAFEGKLVPQDPNDEPAAATLERLRSVASRNGDPRPRKGLPRKRAR